MAAQTCCGVQLPPGKRGKLAKAAAWAVALLLYFAIGLQLTPRVWSIAFPLIAFMFSLPLLKYIWSRLLRDPLHPRSTFGCNVADAKSALRPGEARAVLAPKLVFLGLTAFCLMCVGLAKPMGLDADHEPWASQVLGMNLLGSLMVLVASIWFGDILQFLSILFYYLALGARPYPPRRVWARGKVALALLLWVPLAAHSLTEGYKEPALRELQLPVPNLPDCLDGFRLVLVADLHTVRGWGQAGGRAG